MSVQDSVNQWKEDNPNGTPQQIADAIKSAGGLTPEIAQAVASAYGTNVDEVNAGYERWSAPLSTVAQTSNAPPSNYVSNLGSFSPQNILYNNGIDVNSSAISTPGLTPQLAQDLMWRSMTTGVPTSEFDKYGGYDAVNKAYTAAGGQYDRSTIPTSNLQNYAQTVANTGVGNLELLNDFNYELTPTAVASMRTAGIDPTQYANQYGVQKSYNDIFNIGDVGTIGGVAATGALPWSNVVGPLSPSQQYDQNLYNQTGMLKSGFENIYGDEKVSRSEADAIDQLVKQTGFKAADISRVTGIPIDKVEEALKSKYGFQLNDSAPAMKEELTKIWEDKQVSLEEAGKIKDALAANPFAMEDIARVTGLSIEDIRTIAGAPAKYEQQAYEGRILAQAPEIVSNLNNALQDKSISFEESKQIKDFMKSSGYKVEDVARLTGIPLESLQEVVGSYDANLSNIIKAPENNLLSIFSLKNQEGLTNKDVERLSGGRFTEQQLHDVEKPFTAYINAIEGNGDFSKNMQEFATYVRSDPELQVQFAPQLAAIDNAKSFIDRHALNKDFGGEYKSYAMQMLLGLDNKTKSQAPEQLEMTAPTTKKATAMDPESGGEYTYDVPVPAAPKPGQEGVEPVWSSGSAGDGEYAAPEITGYRKLLDSPAFEEAFPGQKQRFGVYATYDATGKHTGYESNAHVHVNDPQWIGGKWDVNGNATPTSGSNSSGGFLKNMIIDVVGGVKDMVGPELWTIAKFTPAGPYVLAADAAYAGATGDYEGMVVNGVASWAGFESQAATNMQDPTSATYTNSADLASDMATTGTTALSTAQANALLGNTAIGVYTAGKAAEDGNYVPLMFMGAKVAGANKSPEVATALNVVAGATALQNNDVSGMLRAAGNLTGDKDLKLAASSVRLIEAAGNINKPGGFASFYSASQQFKTDLNANDRTRSAARTIENSIKDAANTAKGAVKTTDAGTSGGLQLAGVDNGVVSDAGNGLGPLTTAAPMVRGLTLQEGSVATKNPDGSYSVEWTNPNNPDDKRGYELSFDKDGNPSYGMSNLSQEEGASGSNQMLITTKMPVFDPSAETTEGAGVGSPDKVKPVSESENEDGTFTQAMSDGSIRIVDASGKVISQIRNDSSLDTGIVSNIGGTKSNAGSTIGNISGLTGTGVNTGSGVGVGSGTGTGTGTGTGNGAGGTGTGTGTGTGDGSGIGGAGGGGTGNGTGTGTATVTPPTTSVTSPLSVASVQPKTTTYSPLVSATQTAPMKLDSSPQGLTSTMQKNKKILKDLTMLFGTLTPELVSALEDRGIRVPKVVEPEEDKPEKEQKEPDIEKQLAEDRALETKFAATGGEITSKIDPKISYTPAGMLPAAQVVEQQSRLGALRHLRDSISSRPSGGLAQGGLPKKYADATPDGHKPEFITGLTGYYASGAGTGQSDDIDAILHDGDYVADADLVAALGDGSSKAGAEALEKFRRQVPHQEHAEGGSAVPAKIADGEYVFPASFVTALGRGDNKAGAKLLDKMREAIREHKRSAPVNKIPPKAKSPLDYLKMVKG